MSESGRRGGVDAVLRISQELTLVLGWPVVDLAMLPDDPVALEFDDSPNQGYPSLRIGAKDLGWHQAHPTPLTLWASRSTMTHVGIGAALEGAPAVFHLPSELRAVILALGECHMREETRAIYRQAKAIELLCETARLFERGELVPLTPAAGLSAGDVRRLFEAKRMVEERSTEKLTLDGIGRACGLNRAKLTRGFRDLFDRTISETLLERRLAHARRLLLTTDLPVSAIGYQSGYQSNASFARAFGRRFGMPPSNIRTSLAA